MWLIRLIRLKSASNKLRNQGAWSPAFQSDGPEGLESTADALTLTTQWWPLCSDGRQPSESGKDWARARATNKLQSSTVQ